MQPTPGQLPQSVVMQAKLSRIHVDEWLNEDLFHPGWWILIGLLILSTIVWYLLIDKKRTGSVCLFTAVGAIISLGIFEYGDELILWEYPVDVIPIFPPMTSLNLFILPLSLSILFQHCKSWKSYLAASLAASAILSLAVEPLLSLTGLYELVNWNYLLNLPLYFITAVATKSITVLIERITGNAARFPGQAGSNGIQ